MENNETPNSHPREGVYKLQSCDLGAVLYIIVKKVMYVVCAHRDIDYEALGDMEVLFEMYEKVGTGHEATSTYYRGTYPLPGQAHRVIEEKTKPW